MVAFPRMLARRRSSALDRRALVRPLSHKQATALVVPHAVVVPGSSGWESAWLLACGPETGNCRYLVQRDAARTSEPEWLAEGPVALPAASTT